MLKLMISLRRDICISNWNTWRKIVLSSFLLCACALISCLGNNINQKNKNEQTKAKQKMVYSDSLTRDTATFGAGCFWCVEAIFLQLNGVYIVESGYSGGSVENPTYKQVCSGTTGHAEVCQIVYNPQVISFDDLLEAFWQTHDPTTLNQQGADQGTQYRSAVFFRNNFQKERAEYFKKKLNDEGAFKDPVITEIVPFTMFFKAEDYHQNYFNENGSDFYCTMVIQPKVEKFKKAFSSKIKATGGN